MTSAAEKKRIFNELSRLGQQRGYNSEWAHQRWMEKRALQRRCISCGAKQDAAGNLPCMH